MCLITVVHELRERFGRDRRHTLSSATTSGAPSGRVTVDQRGLVVLAGRGDHDAFALLARGAIARLDAAARLILRDSELARDAVQEALMQAWRDLPGLRDPDRFDAWHRRRRVVEVELDPSDGPTVSDAASLVADRDLLDRALAGLEPDARALIVMHYYLGMSVPDVADSLGIPLGTAKSRLSRSLALMRVAATDDQDGSLGRDAWPQPRRTRGSPTT
jgi:RNA polymerase sigma factor (sigma-70 family)